MPDRTPVSAGAVVGLMLSAFAPFATRRPPELVVYLVFARQTRFVRDRMRKRSACVPNHQHTTARAAWDAYVATAGSLGCELKQQDYMVVPHVCTGTRSDRGWDEYQPIWRTRTGAWKLYGKRYSTFALAVYAEVLRG